MFECVKLMLSDLFDDEITCSKHAYAYTLHFHLKWVLLLLLLLLMDLVKSCELLLLLL